MARIAAIALLLTVTVALSACSERQEEASEQEKTRSVLEHTVKDIDGNEVNIAQRYGEKVLLVVNVASKCGYTPQYEGLQALYERYRDKGFRIAGFPANNFMNQEPGTDEQIKGFCATKFSVKFDMYSKISVKGDDMHPLYTQLTDERAHPYGGEIKWNFTKFLIVNGKVAARYEPAVTPLSDRMVRDIEMALGLR